MKKRLVSLLLCLCLALSPLSVFAAGTHLTVKESAPKTASVQAGALYELELSDVFTDAEGHALTYALSGGDFGQHTKITNGKLSFTVGTAGTYAPTITATCTQGETASHTIRITVSEADAGSERQYGYDETPASSVTVYVTISNDGKPLLSSNDSDAVLAAREVTVPYFDLAYYGLQDYYRYHTEGGQGNYIDGIVVERPTALHLYIYLLERYYMGLPEEKCCKGTSGVLSYADPVKVDYYDGQPAFDGTLSALSISGSATSFFMQEFWGHDLNLKYYRNHAYPFMSPGWGSTADYILLSDGDSIDIGLFTNYDFYKNGEFCCFDKDAYTVQLGDELTTQILRWNATKNDLEPFADMNVTLYDAAWNRIADLSAPEADGTITFTPPQTAGTYYLLAMDQSAATDEAVNAPAAARLMVTTPPVKGYLSELCFSAASSADAEAYVLSPSCDEETFEYTLLVPDSARGAYLRAALSAYAPAGAQVTAAWIGTDGQSKRLTVPDGQADGLWMDAFLDAGGAGNRVTLEVGTGSDMQTYTVDVVRTEPTLASLTGIALNETFAPTTFAYTATTTEDSVTLCAAAGDESYTVTYNGSGDGTVALADGENVIEIRVVNADGYASVYTLTIYKIPELAIRFDVTPEDAVVQVFDPLGKRLWESDGTYVLLAQSGYSYIVTRAGYIGRKNEFTPTQSGTIEITLEKAPENTSVDTTIRAQWAAFRGDNALGMTDAPTPYAPEDTEPLWAVRYGQEDASGAPILVDGDVVICDGTTLLRLDRDTGAIRVEGTMAGVSAAAPTYADGMLFVCLTGGRIQAFNAATLQSLWLYEDPLGGQPSGSATCRDGYLYAGFQNDAGQDGSFVCLSAADEDPTREEEEKLASWRYTGASGFGAAAYVGESYVVVGTTADTDGARLLVFGRRDGRLADVHDGIRGDVRSAISYDPSSDRVFFTSVGGVLYNAKIDQNTGAITDFRQAILKDAKDETYAASAAAPSVCNGRVYVGVSGKTRSEGCGIAVFDLLEDGAMESAYVYGIAGDSQTSVMLTTAYAAEEGYVYVYLPNGAAGGVAVLKDRKGQTAPLTATGADYGEVFAPAAPLAASGSRAAIADEYGTIYLANNSGYRMAITSKIEALEITQMPAGYEKDADGTWRAEGLTVVARLKNGLKRDVTDNVVLTETEEGLVLSYTYGFDGESYSSKTLRIALCTLCEAEGHDYTVSTVPASCEEDGYTEHFCRRCGYHYRDRIVPAAGHDYVAAVTAPTCTTGGYTTHTCTVCGSSYVDAAVAALGHDFEATVTAPTHVEQGYTTHVCKNCGQTYVDSYTQALGHHYESEVTVAPTCTREGVMTFACDCGASYTQSIPMTAHEYEATVTAPTCTQQGSTTYVCKHCGDRTVGDTVAPLGHDGRLQNVREATCMVEGYTGDLVCTRCAQVLSRGQIIAVTYDNCPTLAFRDLRVAAWYHVSTDEMLRRGYMRGTASDLFSPDASLTRGQLVTILYRVSGSPAVSAACPFTDVPQGSYYRDAIVWAYENGIANGTARDRFDPEAFVTREQAVTFFARYARHRGADISQGAALGTFYDAQSVSAYAAQAMAWAVKNGIVGGVGGNRLDPQGTATRVQAAALMQRLCDLLAS